ncbi:MAG: hypothetical protein RIB80_04560 [Rhodospirillales bacterium]
MPVLALKPGVRIHGIRPETHIGITICWSVFQSLGLDMTVTSVTEGKHSRGSLHYQGAAFDLRTRDMTFEQKHAAVQGLADALGDDFDVVVEKTHLHIEYQPKTPY